VLATVWFMPFTGCLEARSFTLVKRNWFVPSQNELFGARKRVGRWRIPSESVARLKQSRKAYTESMMRLGRR
jgi:hypothetical protein